MESYMVIIDDSQIGFSSVVQCAGRTCCQGMD